MVPAGRHAGLVRQLDAFVSRFLARLSTRAPLLRVAAGERLMVAIDDTFTEVDGLYQDADPERAGHFIDRAAALNYDDHEKTAPAAFAASMMLFNAVTDALERSGEGDSRWLEAAVVALSSTTGWGRSQMCHTLTVVRQDYVVEPGESRVIEDAVVEVPEREDLRDVTLLPAELAEAVTSMLQVLQAYRAALNAS